MIAGLYMGLAGLCKLFQNLKKKTDWINKENNAD